MKTDLYLVGGGGHCRACIDVIEQAGGFRIAGIVERTAGPDRRVLGYPVVASDDRLPEMAAGGSLFLVTVGQVRTPDVRIRLYETLEALGAQLATVVSPRAYVSSHARIGRGTVVMHDALINAGARVGDNCIVNTKALVEHDAVVGRHCHIATGAIVNGGVTVAEGTFLGSGAVTREGVVLHERVVAGCNATIKKTVPANRVIE